LPISLPASRPASVVPPAKAAPAALPAALVTTSIALPIVSPITSPLTRSLPISPMVFQTFLSSSLLATSLPISPPRKAEVPATSAPAGPNTAGTAIVTAVFKTNLDHFVALELTVSLIITSLPSS